MNFPSLSAADLQRMAASPGWRAHRVEVFDTAAGRVIVKGHRATRSPRPQQVLGAFAKLFRVSFLRAPVVHGGARSQAIEVARLQALGAAGLPVPRVLHVTPDFFVMTWLGGDHLADVINRRHPAAFDLWRSGGETLLQVHAAGQYLSQCFGRNIIVDLAVERVAGLIDFEDDPLEIMSLPEAQVHDWLIYLQSTLWNLPGSRECVDAALDALMARELPAVRALFARACARLGWLRMLPASRALGRDTYAVQVVAATATRWLRRNRAAG